MSTFPRAHGDLMARPRSIDAATILRAARGLFLARGARATTRDVAAAAGISQALLFQRYGTKTKLYFAAMLPRTPDLADLIGEAPVDGPEPARAYLMGLAGRLLTWLDAAMPGALRAALHPDFPTAVARAHTPPGTDAIAATIAERLATLQARGFIHAAVDTDAMSTAFIELLHGQALLAMLVGDAATEERSRRAVDLVWQGVRP